MSELTHQLGTGPHSVRVLELESECKLAEERITELESQLATAAPMLDAPGSPFLPTLSPPPSAPPPLPCHVVAWQLWLTTGSAVIMAKSTHECVYFDPPGMGSQLTMLMSAGLRAIRVGKWLVLKFGGLEKSGA